MVDFQLRGRREKEKECGGREMQRFKM